MNETPPPPEQGGASAPEAPSSGAKRRVALRWVRRAFALVVALVAAVFVTFFSIDLGRFPQLTRLAEEHGGRFIDRPLHIGRISALVTPGAFTLHDIVIEGRRPEDRPFMTIDRVRVNVPWWTIFRRELHVNVRLDGWTMVVETWAGGLHNVPRLTGPPRPPRTGPRSFTTTVDYAYARGGSFIYEDHVTPWGVTAPNLTFDFARATGLNEYVGRAGFTGGTVQIQRYQPMATDMEMRFVLDGSIVRLQHVDLVADGSVSHASGEVGLGQNWPNQLYNVTSEIDFSRMKELFFTRETWRLGGTGAFTGQFMLGKNGARDLTGRFSSSAATVNDIEFTNLDGALTWKPQLFAVTHATSNLFGGEAKFSYSLAPLGTPNPATATFDAEYENVDLFGLDRVMGTRGLRVAGVASGNLSLQWPNGRMTAGRRGTGRTVITPLASAPMAPAELPVVPIPLAHEPSPFDGSLRSTPLSISAELDYQFEPGVTTFGPSRVTTSHSHITFSGRMPSEGASEFPFHVTSHDWQESDRLLAGIMTAVAGPTRAIEVGGRGVFDGRMTGLFSAPRIEGHFEGDSMRVWDVTWGQAAADLVIEGGYVDITNSRITNGETGVVNADGRFAVGFRRDGAEEIRAHVRLAGWPVSDLRHAFTLDDWPMDGTVGVAELDLTGRYRDMFGSGRITINDGRAWGERFEVASADLELEGTGMRVTRLEMQKGAGRISGAARVGWDGTYAFNAEGVGVPVESLDSFRVEAAPLSGRLRFTASGAGEFDAPTYAFDASIGDLFVSDEGIGAVTGRVTIANNVMTIERLAAASSRLQVVGTGTIALDEPYTSDLRLRFQETSIDPYLKFVLTDDVSPYTRAVLGGTLTVSGPLSTPTDLTVDAVIDDTTLTLYDYDLRNDGPIRMKMADGRVSIDALELQGRDTNLEMGGGIDLRGRQFDVAAVGDASMSILQLFFEGMTSTGAARLNAKLSGPFDAPVLTGEATLADGRLRPLASPHSLEALNGRITFGANAISFNGLTGRIGSGDVAFDGSISLDGYRLGEFNMSARGRSMRLRYPAGFNSTVDMNLLLTGSSDQPLLTGTIDVLRVAFAGTTSGSGLLGLATAGTTGAGIPATEASAVDGGTGLALDIQVAAPRMPFINNNTARIEGTADLRVRGTFDVPTIEGRLDIVGGEVTFNGNRYLVREGGVDFVPNQSDPVFDFAAETRVRASGETFTVNVTAGGTMGRASIVATSDPWLPESDVISLLFGGVPTLGNAEERSLGSSQEMQQQMLQTAGAALLASPITSRVGEVVERTGAFDTVQITPILRGATPFQQFNPTARVTFGKRISPRVFLTYSRNLSGLEEEIILLEYDQNDRLSWVLSRNEDRTFALDFRIRYVF